MLSLLMGLWIQPAVVVALGLAFGERLTPWAAVNIALYPAVIAVSIVLHELGHFAAARAVGLQVPRIELGIGQRLHKWSWRGTAIVLNALPLGGQTLVGDGEVSATRWRCWLTVLAGPIVTAAIGGAAWWWLGFPGIGAMFAPMRGFNGHLAIGELFGFASSWLLVLNLAPLSLVRHPMGARNDGMLLLTLPVARPEFLRELGAMSAVAEAMDLWEKDDHAGARAVLEAALRRAPGSVAVRNSLAVTLLHEGRLREARDVFVELLAEQPPDSELRWVLRNNIASADFEIRADDLRAEADEHSAAVLARYKEVAWALATRGAVLVWLGRYGEAIPMLERAYVRSSDPTHRARQACCLTMALAASKRLDDARGWLTRAAENHPACPLLAEARACVATSDVT